MKTRLGHTDDNTDLYPISVPGYHKSDFERTVHQTVVIPRHEQIDNDIANAVSFRNRLAEARADGTLPPAYWQHAIVQRCRDRMVAPVAIYVDAVPYSESDSVIGWWMVNLLSGRRFLVGLLRKRLSCRCGCRGWCSFYAIFRALHWMIKCGADGVWATARHDREPWQPLDVSRAAKSGQHMVMPFAVFYIKVDWSEAASTFGLPSWQDGLWP